jgi:hypothetical protein
MKLTLTHLFLSFLIILSISPPSFSLQTDPPFTLSITPFILNDKSIDIQLTLDQECLNEEDCEKERSFQIILTPPCQSIPETTPQIDAKMVTFSGLTDSVGVSSDILLKREEFGEEKKLVRFVGDFLLKKKDQNFEQVLNLVTNQKNNNESEIIESLQANIFFPQLSTLFLTSCLDLTQITPLNFDIVQQNPENDHKNDDIYASASFSILSQTLGQETGSGYNPLSEMYITLKKVPDAISMIYNLKVNFYIDSVKEMYTQFAQNPKFFSIFLVPTGTLQNNMVRIGYKVSKCQILGTEIRSDDITMGTDVNTGLSYYILHLTPGYTKDDRGSPYFGGHIIKDQFQASCEFVAKIPFLNEQNAENTGNTGNTENTENSTQLDEIYINPLLRKQDWGFTVAFRGVFCPSIDIIPLFDPICSGILPFWPRRDKDNKVGKNINVVNLPTAKVDFSTQVNFSELFSNSHTIFHRSIHTTVPINHDKITDEPVTKQVLRSFVSYSLPLPQILLTKEKFVSPAELNLIMNINTHEDDIYQLGSYTVQCIDGGGGDKPMVYLTGEFFNVNQKDEYFVTEIQTIFAKHFLTKVGIDKKKEKFEINFPEKSDNNFNCKLNIVIMFQNDNVNDRSHRTLPLPSVIIMANQQFEEKDNFENNNKNENEMIQVKSIFEAPLQYLYDYESPYGVVATDKVAVRTTMKEGQQIQNGEKNNDIFYSLEFQFRNSNSFKKVLNFDVSLLGNHNWRFAYPNNGGSNDGNGGVMTCTIEGDKSSKKKGQHFEQIDNFSSSEIETITPTLHSVHLMSFKSSRGVLADETVMVSCPGLMFVKVGQDNFENNNFENNTTNAIDVYNIDPIIGIRSGKTYAGYLLGPDAVKPSFKPNKTLKLILFIAIPIFIIFLIISICCCCFFGCPCGKKNKKSVNDQIENDYNELLQGINAGDYQESV